MSSENTLIKWGTRYTVNSTALNATGGRASHRTEAVRVTASEDIGRVKRKPGEVEATIDITGNIATDVNPHATPFFIEEGSVVAEIKIYFKGIGGNPNIYRNVLIETFESVSEGGDGNTPNTFHLVGYTSDYTKA